MCIIPVSFVNTASACWIRDADWVMDQLEIADSLGANLLLNIGPLPDGALPEEDIITLREVGKRRSR